MGGGHDAVDSLQGIQDPLRTLVDGQPSALMDVRFDVLTPVLPHLVRGIEIHQDMGAVPCTDLDAWDCEHAFLFREFHRFQGTADEIVVGDRETYALLLGQSDRVRDRGVGIRIPGMEMPIGTEEAFGNVFAPWIPECNPFRTRINPSECDEKTPVRPLESKMSAPDGI